MGMRGFAVLDDDTRSFRRRVTVVVVFFFLVALAPAAEGFEAFDGRLQVHGFFEQQTRALSNNFDLSDDLDLAAMQQILNLELEYDFAPDGWGPFDIVSSFLRIEARYDCVWTRSCGIFPSADQFGNRANRLPGVKASGRSSGFSGSFLIGDANSGPVNERHRTNRFLEVRNEPTIDGRDVEAGGPDTLENPVLALQQRTNSRKVARLDQVPGFSPLLSIRGLNQEFERGGDDPGFSIFSEQLNCKFGVRSFPGGENGIGNQILGPLNPNCEAKEKAALAARPNPFNPSDFNPVLTDLANGGAVFPGLRPFGSGELPARPAAEFAVGTLRGGGGTSSTGLFLPSPGFQRAQRTRNLDDPKQNFSEGQLAWNRGDSQGWERELKEAYLDLEFFDSRLWIRAGRQNIVWGKTELFRSTDQFNPQDLALSSLPSLEESRVALWSLRAVWSFYNVGPLEDLRLELAANIDQFKPSDIGQCGEPFTALAACNKRSGLFVNGLLGTGLAGEDRPDSPWQDIEGLEFGARVEFRVNRFSFQLSNFVGFDDLPFADLIQSFERRVDPATGRPVRASSRGGCTTGQEAACLPLRSNLSLNGRDDDPAFVANGQNARTGAVAPGQTVVIPDGRADVINEFSGNLQLFSVICASTLGFTELDPSACGQSVFNSLRIAGGNAENQLPLPRSGAKTQVFPSLASLLSNTAAGNASAGVILALGTDLGGIIADLPFVPLNEDPCDRFFSLGNGGCTNGADPNAPQLVLARTRAGGFTAGATLNEVLTDEQEALLGCGPFWGTDCEADGIDPLNADAGVLMQAWVGFPGNYTPEFIRSGFRNWNLGNGSPQPGTIGFVQNGSSLPATRVVAGQVVQVPGARSPLLADGVTPNPDFASNQDGCVSPAAPGCDDASRALAGLAPANTLALPSLFLDSAGQVFANELAALSFNVQMALAAASTRAAGATSSERNEFDPDNPFAAWDPGDPATEPFRGQCSFLQPQFCSGVQALIGLAGAQRNSVRAGGNAGFGRWDFIWHSGGQAILRHTKRNVLGFAFDVAEDVTKTNWSVETTWISRQAFSNVDRFDGVEESGTINLSISIDRPTFVNFLNANRTFLINSQWFVQYITDYDKGFVTPGPFNLLATVSITTAYFQDRLIPSTTFVYDRRSNSGAGLAAIAYRFTENFTGIVGMNSFWGRFQTVDVPIQPVGPVGNEVGSGAFTTGVENGLSAIRERDELFLRIRYTF